MTKRHIKPNSRFCSVSGCEGLHDAKGYCSNHYRRFKAYGDPLGKAQPRPKKPEFEGICTIEGCTREIKRKGTLCYAHYMREYRTGDPLSITEKKMKFLRDVVATPSDECVLWPFSVRDSGYGGATYEGKMITAHRLALILLTGENPEGMVAAHGRCHNRLCVNPHPEHGMRWATQTENNLDRRIDGTMTNGEKSGVAVNTEDQIRSAYRMYAEGRRLCEIENETGVARSVILGVVRGRQWIHLNLPVLPYRYEKYESATH